MSNTESSAPECKICYEVYNLKDRKPVSFMCGHGFCERCVFSIRNVRRNQTGYYITGNKFKCPLCKGECSQFIYNRDLMDSIEMKCPHDYDPVKRTLYETLEFINKEIYHKTKKYGKIQRNIAILNTEIKEIEKCHHMLFDQHFEEVRRKSQVEYDMIINDAKKNANRINTEAKEDANRITNDAKEDANRIINDAKEHANKIINEVKVVGQHKRNFITKYDDMIDNLQQFKTLMKQLEITYPSGKLV